MLMPDQHTDKHVTSAFSVTNLAQLAQRTLQAVRISLWTRLSTGEEVVINVAAG
jgi:hypothetical protein